MESDFGYSASPKWIVKLKKKKKKKVPTIIRYVQNILHENLLVDRF